MYDRTLVGSADADRLRRILSDALAELDVPVSVLLLTVQEHCSSRFAEMEEAVLIWSRRREAAVFDSNNPEDS